MSPPAIAVAVVEHQGRFLVGVRPPGVPLAGMWEFPGGKVEPGEQLAQAAARECFEETGLEIVVVEAYPDRRQDYEGGPVHLHFFACRPVDPRVEPRSPFRWVSREALADLEFPIGNRDMLEVLLSQKNRPPE